MLPTYMRTCTATVQFCDRTRRVCCIYCRGEKKRYVNVVYISWCHFLVTTPVDSVTVALGDIYLHNPLMLQCVYMLIV